MENRRLDYRHVFDLTRRPHVRLRLAQTAPTAQSTEIEAELVDLSLKGMSVHIAGAAGLHVAERVRAALNLAEGAELTGQAVVVHVGDETAGFRFLPTTNDAANEQFDKSLWQFLLREQWALRRNTKGYA